MRSRIQEARLPDRADIEAMLAEQTQFEEEALQQGRLTLFEFCALRYLPGVGELPLLSGRTLGPLPWGIFPRRRRGHTSR